MRPFDVLLKLSGDFPLYFPIRSALRKDRVIHKRHFYISVIVNNKRAVKLRLPVNSQVDDISGTKFIASDARGIVLIGSAKYLRTTAAACILCLEVGRENTCNKQQRDCKVTWFHLNLSSDTAKFA
ncbi:MAG: hypothetical protein WKF30_12015 [Pyrinomonadaceae bacterium]